MTSLSGKLRRKLEKAVVEARKVAEHGARQTLEALTVHEAKRGDHVESEDQIQLRNRLRAHGRFLGDRRSESGWQSIDRLVEECAYQHWHRILFARFLAENDCLWHPELKALVSLEEVDELAHEEGTHQWELAGRFAQAALPAIFPADNPVLEVKLPREIVNTLIELVEQPASENDRTGLVREVFRADDSLGWVYQFWQNDANERANKSEEKINAATLPAVTQFFTEDYMVMFLLHNTLGAWHAGKVLAENPELANTAKDEEELRRAVALSEAGGYEFEYLRFVKVEEASSLLQPKETNTDKSLEGSSTFDFTWFDWKEPIHVDGGNLPHVKQEGVTYFVTFRTADSLPAEKWKKWHAEREAWIAKHPEPLSEADKKEYYEVFPAQIEHWLDQKYGDLVLARPETQKIVDDALHHFDAERYRLDEYAIAGNHVHALVTPLGENDLSDILHSWKSFTANKINKLIGKEGKFWQKESFDHAVRSGESLIKFRAYIRGHDSVDAASSRVTSGDKSLEGSSTWRPMGGAFEGWPQSAAELKVLDPCCGSGHFLVAAFELLVRLRMCEESLSLSAAIDAVLSDNLFGLELDKRCVQIAVFNVAMSAWRLDRYRELPSMTIAHVGQSIGATREQWMSLVEEPSRLLQTQPTQQTTKSPAGRSLGGKSLEGQSFGGKSLEGSSTKGLGFFWGQLYDMFSQAAILGSLINPRRLLDSFLLSDEQTEYLYELLETAIEADPNTEPDSHELGLAAKGLATATRLLSGQYHLLTTNVPYLGRGKQSDTLQNYVDSHFKLGRADLSTVCVLRILQFLCHGGTASLVTPQNWFFLKTYAKLREYLIDTVEFNSIATLGPNAFKDMNWWAATTGLAMFSRTLPDDSSSFGGVDTSGVKPPQGKAALLRGSRDFCEENGEISADGFSLITDSRIASVSQAGIRKNPDSRFVISHQSRFALLRRTADAHHGLTTGDSLRMQFQFWEVSDRSDVWEWFMGSCDESEHFGGRSNILRWCSGEGAIDDLLGARKDGREAWGQQGVLVRQMRHLPVTLYSGEPFDNNTATLVPFDPVHLPAVWSFARSPKYHEAVRKIDQKVSVTSATLALVPFDLDYWQGVAEKEYPNGLPEPESDDPTQWLFHGWPSESTSPLQVAVARLLGYRWPAELDSEMRLSERARELVARCSELNSFVDDDGIVCIPSVRGEDAAADRLARLLAGANVDAASRRVIGLHKSLEGSSTLDDWLRNKFFKEHCETFDQRPFIWHIYDGRKQDGFHALVNYHKLAGPGGRKVLESLTYSYLGDWITRQKDEVARELPAAEARLLAAEALFNRLEAILAGEPPYDLFVRWKPIHKQPIGFEPDINDGVRINIRPFMATDLAGVPKGAGVFRVKPKIKWTKDRGKEPERPIEEYPWFWGYVDAASSRVSTGGKGSKSLEGSSTANFTGGDDFDGVRWNDCHYTNEFKLGRRALAAALPEAIQADHSAKQP